MDTNPETLFGLTITILLAVQAVVNYFLPPEKAAKFNFIGTLLDVLSRTKGGVSPQVSNPVKETTEDKIKK